MITKDRIADKIKTMKPSASMALAQKAKQMKAEGVDVIDLTLGEPRFDTPDTVKKAVKGAVDRNYTHYTQAAGIASLRQAIAKKLDKENGVTYNPDTEILVTPGAKQAIFYALAAMLNAGDEVLIPEPCWLSYADITLLCGGIAVGVPASAETGFKPTYDALRSQVSPKTKAVMINTPNNPTGAVLSLQNLDDVARLAKEEGLIVISDEIYERVIFDGRKHISIASLPGMKEQTVTINGFSKTFAMTGWRIGYIAGPADLIKAAGMVHQHLATCAVSFVQEAAATAFESTEQDIERMVAAYAKRRELVLKHIERLPKLSCLTPEGSFYAFIDIRKLGMTSQEAAAFLLEKQRIATVPGDAYGKSGEGYLRISFAASESEINEAFNRLKAVWA